MGLLMIKECKKSLDTLPLNSLTVSPTSRNAMGPAANTIYSVEKPVCQNSPGPCTPALLLPEVGEWYTDSNMNNINPNDSKPNDINPNNVYLNATLTQMTLT